MPCPSFRDRPPFAALVICVVAALVLVTAPGPRDVAAAPDGAILVDWDPDRVHRSPWRHVGRVGLRMTTYALPDSVDPLGGWGRRLMHRTGLFGTELSSVRVEVTLPDGVRFESLEARLADGLVLERDASLLRAVGRAVRQVLRVLLLGQLVSAVDTLELPNSLWTLALGMPETGDEAVRVRATDRLRFARDDENTTDHGRFVVGRAVLALTPFSELIALRVHGRVEGTGESVVFDVPRFVVPRRDLSPFTAPPTRAITAWSSVEHELRVGRLAQSAGSIR